MLHDETDHLRSELCKLQGIAIPEEGVAEEGGRILRQKLIESRILFNSLYAQQPVGDMGR